MGNEAISSISQYFEMYPNTANYQGYLDSLTDGSGQTPIYYSAVKADILGKYNEWLGAGSPTDYTGTLDRWFNVIGLSTTPQAQPPSKGLTLSIQPVPDNPPAATADFYAPAPANSLTNSGAGLPIMPLLLLGGALLLLK